MFETPTIRRLNNNGRSISAAARCISLAFSTDPLICWLRPGAVPWARLDAETMKWQQRRVQRALADGYVLTCGGVSPPSKGNASATELLEESCAAVATIQPVQPPCSWSLRGLLPRLGLWLAEWIDPVHDTGADEDRVNIMMQSHDELLVSVASKIAKPLWYLEFIAVDPSYQGRGLGNTMMKHLLAEVDNPVVLECTSEQNISFYEKHGFKLLERYQLRDPKGGDRDGVSLFIFLRE